MRDKSLKRQLDVEPGFLNDRVVPQPQRHISAGRFAFRIGGPNGRLAPLPRGPVVACIATKIAAENSERSTAATTTTMSIKMRLMSVLHSSKCSSKTYRFHQHGAVHF